MNVLLLKYSKPINRLESLFSEHGSCGTETWISALARDKKPRGCNCHETVSVFADVSFSDMYSCFLFLEMKFISFQNT